MPEGPVRPVGSVLRQPDSARTLRAVEREPLCAPLQSPQPVRACMFGPPSFGGVAALQMLQMMQSERIDAARLDDPAFWHRYAEAGRLARADRRFWVGDPDFVNVPPQALVALPYVDSRAAQIDAQRAAKSIRHGEPVPPRTAQSSEGDRIAADATSQLVAASRWPTRWRPASGR